MHPLQPGLASNCDFDTTLPLTPLGCFLWVSDDANIVNTYIIIDRIIQVEVICAYNPRDRQVELAVCHTVAIRVSSLSLIHLGNDALTQCRGTVLHLL